MIKTKSSKKTITLIYSKGRDYHYENDVGPNTQILSSIHQVI